MNKNDEETEPSSIFFVAETQETSPDKSIFETTKDRPEVEITVTHFDKYDDTSLSENESHHINLTEFKAIEIGRPVSVADHYSISSDEGVSFEENNIGAKILSQIDQKLETKKTSTNACLPVVKDLLKKPKKDKSGFKNDPPQPTFKHFKPPEESVDGEFTTEELAQQIAQITHAQRCSSFLILPLRLVLSLVNFLVIITGLAFLVVGIWGNIDQRFDQVKDPKAILSDPTFSCLIIGVVMIIFGTQAFLGFWRENVSLLKCYSFLLVLLNMLFCIGTTLIWIKSHVVWSVIKYIFGLLLSEYKTSRQSVKFFIDSTQTLLSCCGIEDKADWSKVENFSCDSRTNLCYLPKSCCDGSLNETCAYISGVENDKASIFKVGCLEGLSSELSENQLTLIIVWCCIFAVMIVELFTINMILRTDQLVKYIEANLETNKTKAVFKASKKLTLEKQAKSKSVQNDISVKIHDL